MTTSFPEEDRSFEKRLLEAPSLFERPAGFAESFEAEQAYMLEWFNSQAYDQHRFEIVDELLDQYRERTGSAIRNPEAIRGREPQTYGAQLEMATTQLEQAGLAYPSEDDVHGAAIARMRAAFEATEAFRARPQGLGGTLGSLLGGAVGFLKDPLQAGSVFVGGGGGTVTRFAAREFFVNATVETAVQGLTFGRKQEAVPDFGVRDAAGEILTAGAFGAGIGLTGRLAAEAIGTVSRTLEGRDAVRTLQREAEIDLSNPLEPTAPAAAAHRSALETAERQFNAREAVDVEPIVQPYRRVAADFSEGDLTRLRALDPDLDANLARARDRASATQDEVAEARHRLESISEADIVARTDETTADRLRAIDEELSGTPPARRRRTLEQERESVLSGFGDVDRGVSDLRIGPSKQLRQFERRLREAEREVRRLSRRAHETLETFEAGVLGRPTERSVETSPPPPRGQAPAAAEAAARAPSPEGVQAAPEAPQTAPGAAPAASRPPPKPGEPEESLQAPEEARMPEPAEPMPEAALEPEAIAALEADVDRVLEERTFNVKLADDEGSIRKVSARKMMEEADEEIQQVAEIMSCAVGGVTGAAT